MLLKSLLAPSELPLSFTWCFEVIEDTDEKLFIITYPDNKHMFGGKATKKICVQENS